MIQLIIRSQGCILWSARDFREEIERVGKLISEEKGKHTGNAKNYLFAHADAETQKYLEAVVFPAILYIFRPALNLSPLNHQHAIQRIFEIFEIERDFKPSDSST